jgi:threonine synthase
MYYISTRKQTKPSMLSNAITKGLAPDGGLFIPKQLPIIDWQGWSTTLSYPAFSAQLLYPFFEQDSLAPQLSTLLIDTFTFPIPLKKLDDTTFVLELFHGPTASFKDFGARFLARCLEAIPGCQKTILVATSGDTGSAVASAFYHSHQHRVIILYPKGQISPVQEQQLTCWDDNILAIAVCGNFDECQQLVKSAFQQQSLSNLSSANSINIGRLLPQMTYYAYTSVQFYQKHHMSPGFIIPSGNLGHATAAYWAQAMGFPIREIVLSTNANTVLSDYLSSGDYTARPSIRTLANAMDVGNPSNFERLQYLFPTFEKFKQHVRAISVTDTEIGHTMQTIYQCFQYISCPHTATAFYARKKLNAQPWIVVSTADPSKFSTVIEPIIQTTVPMSANLRMLLNRKTTKIEINPMLSELTEYL